MSKNFREMQKEVPPAGETTVIEETIEIVSNTPNEPEVTIEGTEPVLGKVAGCAHLNIRKKPDGDVIGVIPEGSSVIIDDELTHEDWYEVTIESGIKGFCMKKFIAKE